MFLTLLEAEKFAFSLALIRRQPYCKMTILNHKHDLVLFIAFSSIFRQAKDM